MSSWRLQKAFFLEEVDHEDLFTYEELYVPIPHNPPTPTPKVALRRSGPVSVWKTRPRPRFAG